VPLLELELERVDEIPGSRYDGAMTPATLAPTPTPLQPLLDRPTARLCPLDRAVWLRTLFTDTASDYDRVERWLSFGSGRWYRRQALLRAGLRPGMRVADIATGTGLVAREALKVVGPDGQVVGIDPSLGMLQRASRIPHLRTELGTAESLPFAAESVDFISMGYALRHVEDLRVVFREFARILKPGGRVCILEISRPRGALSYALLRAHLRLVAGAARLVGKASRTAELWRYYLETIERCVPAESIVDALAEAGFSDARQVLIGGIFSEFIGTRASGLR